MNDHDIKQNARNASSIIMSELLDRSLLDDVDNDIRKEIEESIYGIIVMEMQG